MRQVTSLKELETFINQNEEVVVRKNNKNNIFDDNTVKKLLKSEEDIEKGRTRKATEVIKELRAKYLLLI